MQTFRPEERLRGTKCIEQLFSEGKTLKIYPFSVKWISGKEEWAYPAKVAFAVPKRKFKKAVDRNRIRRKIREAYRKHKQVLYETLKKSDERYSILIIYTGDNKPSYREIEDKIILLLQRLCRENEKTAELYTGGEY